MYSVVIQMKSPRRKFVVALLLAILVRLHEFISGFLTILWFKFYLRTIPSSTKSQV
jgi:hypothetical protein